MLLYPFTTTPAAEKVTCFQLLAKGPLMKNTFGDLEGYLHLPPTKLLAARWMDSINFQQYTIEKEGIRT